MVFLSGTFIPKWASVSSNVDFRDQPPVSDDDSVAVLSTTRFVVTPVSESDVFSVRFEDLNTMSPIYGCFPLSEL